MLFIVISLPIKELFIQQTRRLIKGTYTRLHIVNMDKMVSHFLTHFRLLEIQQTHVINKFKAKYQNGIYGTVPTLSELHITVP